MLTNKTIQSAIRDVTTETVLIDGSTPGGGSLYLVVRRLKNGSTSAAWVARWKRDGKQQKLSIGRYPDMTLAEAREKFAGKISPLLRAGKTPTVMQIDGGRPTVERLFQAYADHMKAQGKASADEVERQLLKAKDNAADGLGRNRLAGEIEPSDVASLVAKWFKRGRRGAADKVRSYVASAYSWAIHSANDYTVSTRQEWGINANPAAAVAKDRQAIKPGVRNLDKTELAALWAATVPGQNGFTLETAACIRLLICTGQRVTAVLRLEGSELDTARGVWAMPSHKTKIKREHAIPVPEIALPLLRELKAKRGDGLLFPAREGACSEVIDHRSIMQAIDRWLALDGVTVADFQTRDIRRTWKSRTGEIGISREIRDLIQMHSRNDTGSKFYDLADYLPLMREAMDKWEAWLIENVTQPQPVAAAA